MTRTPRKYPSYRDAIDWIAQNDSTADSDADDPEVVGYLVTSCLVADVWGKDNEEVGRAVVRRRQVLGLVAS